MRGSLWWQRWRKACLFQGRIRTCVVEVIGVRPKGWVAYDWPGSVSKGVTSSSSALTGTIKKTIRYYKSNYLCWLFVWLRMVRYHRSQIHHLHKCHPHHHHHPHRPCPSHLSLGMNMVSSPVVTELNNIIWFLHEFQVPTLCPSSGGCKEESSQHSSRCPSWLSP